MLARLLWWALRLWRPFHSLLAPRRAGPWRCALGRRGPPPQSSECSFSTAVLGGACAHRLAVSLLPCGTPPPAGAFWMTIGFFMWGIFVVGHDCGHSNFSDYTVVNDVLGNLLHASIMVPYWPWRLSHVSRMHTWSNVEACTPPHTHTRTRTQPHTHPHSRHTTTHTHAPTCTPHCTRTHVSHSRALLPARAGRRRAARACVATSAATRARKCVREKEGQKCAVCARTAGRHRCSPVPLRSDRRCATVPVLPRPLLAAACSNAKPLPRAARRMPCSAATTCTTTTRRRTTRTRGSRRRTTSLSTRPEPFNSTPMGVNPISPGSPHVRPMGVHRTCGA